MAQSSSDPTKNMHVTYKKLSVASRSRLPFPARVGLACASLLAASCTTHHEPAAQTRTGEGLHLEADQLDFIRVAKVEADKEGATVTTRGRIAYDEDRVARLTVPVSGRIVEIKVKGGELVKAGQVLAVIHSPDAASAQANLAQDRAQRVQAEQSANRAERLLESGAGSQRELEEARTNLKQAKAAEEKDEAMLRVLGNGARDPNPIFEVRSPLGGTVTERHATLGGAARPDDPIPLFVVGDLSHVWALVDVFEQDVGLVQKGSEAQVSVPAYPDQVFKGEVAQVGDIVDTTSRTVKVRLSMNNANLALKPEMFARVSLRAAARGTSRVPEGAILTKADHTYVFIEDEERHFTKREVIIGSRLEGFVQILKGVAPGEQVVSEGALLLDAEMSQRI